MKKVIFDGDVIPDSFLFVPTSGPPARRGLRTVLAALATLAGVWLPAIRMDAGQTEAGATLLAMFILSPAALVLAYPIGYFGGWVVTQIGEGFGADIPEWVSELTGAAFIGLAAGALPWFLLGNLCSMAVYLGKPIC